MLDEDDVLATVRDLWTRHREELPAHDRIYGFVRGRIGVPSVPDGAGEELQDIAHMSVKNVLAPVRDAFARNLSVVGFRAAADSENSAVWELWQEQRLDARQAEVHRAAITYGTAYAIVEADGIRLRSPRQVFAVYADVHVDEWPVFALETWIDRSGRKPLRRGRLFDESHVYPVTLGTLSREQDRAEETHSTTRRVTPMIDGEPEAHGLDFPPVVRFVNSRDVEDAVIGEVEPHIGRQKAINAVNFDRLTVSRYGAFPQKYVIGWAPKTSSELVQASVQRLMSFEDDAVKAGSFVQASVEPYNAILNEMLLDVAVAAGIPPFGLNGSVANLSADALALLLQPYNTKLGEKQESFGESWEQALRAYAALHGVEVADDAEVVWRDTEARSFAQMVDGIVKLTTADVPIEVLIEDIPGWSEQRLTAARTAIRRAQGSGVLDRLRTADADQSAV